ncbi:hypothetical protein FH972_016666 [Carpinus fangiana]|uniref:Transcription repressor n=1 Tax=Carpinus fangiana TaxID=176857 RepID=A0A5N6RKC2_9ROSI|nr:hypothetical protein FH972_016666 [Carpinus fangiana]
MGKKMKLPAFIFKNTEASSSSWPWPSCKQPRTLSFRIPNDIYKTINSIYMDPAVNDHVVETTTESFFTNSSESASFSTTSEDSRVDPVETLIRGLRSERLFFKPGETSSILEEAKEGGFPFKESVVLSMESQHPYVDFRKSMEEMVEAHGVKDWEAFEELLCWYLRVNGKSNHGYIIGAFVDLLVGLEFANSSSSCSCSCSHSSPLSLYTSSFSSSTPCISLIEDEEDGDPRCLSSLLECEEEIEEKDDTSSLSV